MLRFTAEQEAFIRNERMRQAVQAANMRRMFNLPEQPGASMFGNATTLPKDVWGEWDREGVAIQRDILSVFNDLAASVSQGIPIGKFLHYFLQVGDSGEAHLSLDGRSKARNDQPEYNYIPTPVPIIDSTFGFGWRQIEAARTEGWALDVTARENAQRKVAEKLESLVLVGDSSIVIQGSQLYGLTNHPQRNSRSTGVTLNGATGAQWLAEIKATLALLQADNFWTDVTLYVNTADWYYASNNDYATNYPKTIANRIREMDYISDIVPGSKVPANTIIAVVKRKSVLQILNAMPMVTRAQARLNPEDDYNYVVMAAAALELKYDANGAMGVAVSS